MENARKILNAMTAVALSTVSLLSLNLVLTVNAAARANMLSMSDGGGEAVPAQSHHWQGIPLASGTLPATHGRHTVGAIETTGQATLGSLEQFPA